jgi:putative PIG3 family NAD(P)H quinone oxidoreductase
MQAITIPVPGPPSALVLAEVDDPVPGQGEVVIDVAAAGVNRADLGQREGTYPSPPGASPLAGMEISGIVSELGPGVTGLAVGDRVCALLPGGGYASRAVASAGLVLPVPQSLDLVDAAGLPEAIATVWSNVFMLARLAPGELLLIHGGSSGIGTMAIQMARAFGCVVATTAGSAEKLAACEALGAEILIDYRREDFVRRILDATDERGADVILDAIGGGYLDRDLHAIARNGRLVFIGNQSGETGALSIPLLMRKWASVHGSLLRSRPLDERQDIIASVRENVWPWVEAGLVRPVIDERVPFAEARRAHERLESSANIGKVLLVP